MKYWIIIVLFFSANYVYAQSKKECEKFLNQKIVNSDTIPQHDALVYYEATLALEGCGLDSIDIEILKNDEFAKAYLVDLIVEKDATIIKYRDLLEKYKKHTDNSFYKEFRKTIIQLNYILYKKINIKNWENDSLHFVSLGANTKDLGKIKEGVLTYQDKNITYQILLESYIDLNEPVELFDYQKIARENNYEDILLKAKKENKPILLYFTGYGSLNCRQIEDSVLSDPTIINTIRNDFIFFPLFADDKTPLKEDEIYKSKHRRNFIVKTKGQKNIDLQIEKFQSNAQPLFIIMDYNEKNLAMGSHIYNINSFLELLNKGLEAFNN